MAKLTGMQESYIVGKVASFEPPRQILIDFTAMFDDTKITEDDVRRLDPESGAVLSPTLHSHFMQTREQVLLDPKSAPFAEQKARLVALSNDVRFYRGNNQLPLAASTLRQIAEELGIIGAAAKKPKDGGDEAKELLLGITRTVIDPTKSTPQEEN